MSTIADHIWVPGIPRGFGSEKTERQWLDAITGCKALKEVAKDGGDAMQRYSVVLKFIIDPHSGCYGPRYKKCGPDLDNLVKLTIDGLSKGRKDEKELRIMPGDNTVMAISARKRNVESGEEPGAFVTIKTV